MKDIYIFGAHSRGTTLKKYLETLYKDMTIKGFLINDDQKNPQEVDGIPVLKVDNIEETGNTEEIVVYLGIRGQYHNQIKELLREKGFTNVIPVTPELDNELRNRFLSEYFKEKGKSFEKFEDLVNQESLEIQDKLEDHKSQEIPEKYEEQEELEDKKELIHNKKCNIFIIRSVYDKTSANGLKANQTYVEIQVGAALTNERICELVDTNGDNISKYNSQFCELTGLYWMWKNTHQYYVGLEHYRRHFILPDNWEKLLEENNIDVILPTPLYIDGGIGANYRMRHVEEDWWLLMNYIRENSPEEYEDMYEFFENTYTYSPCNMFIMKKSVLDEYCQWLFPILFACHKKIGTHEDVYQNRYPGFMAERLKTYYFEKKRLDLRKVYCDKNFISV